MTALPRNVVLALPAVAVTSLIAFDVIHVTLGLALGLAAALLLLDSLGWRIVSATFHRGSVLGEASPGQQSGNRYVPMLGGKPPLLRTQVRVPYGDDDGEVVADRAALQPDPTEANSLERRPGNPDRREEVTVEAPHHDIAAHVVAETPTHDRSSDDDHHQEDKRGEGLRRHVLGVLADVLCRQGPLGS